MQLCGFTATQGSEPEPKSGAHPGGACPGSGRTTGRKAAPPPPPGPGRGPRDPNTPAQAPAATPSARGLLDPPEQLPLLPG